MSQPGVLFGFDAESGYSGLLTGKKAVLVLTSAVYGQGRPASFGIDFQRPYLEWWLNWAGIEDVTTIEFRPNLVTDQADLRRSAAVDEVRDAALKLRLGRKGVICTLDRGGAKSLRVCSPRKTSR